MARPALLALAAAVALAGCGGSDDKGASKPAAKTTEQTKNQEPASSASAAKKTLAVKIADFEYGPKKATVAKGAKVTWTNADPANHTVTFDSGARESLGNQAKGATKSFTFAKAGVFAYHCDYHPNMHGTIVVR